MSVLFIEDVFNSTVVCVEQDIGIYQTGAEHAYQDVNGV